MIETDQLFLQSIKSYSNLNEVDREKVYSGLTVKHIHNIEIFISRSPFFAIQKEDNNFFKYTALGIALLDFKIVDYREIYSNLEVLLYFSIKREASVAEIFEYGSSLGNKKNKYKISNFPSKFNLENLSKTGINYFKEISSPTGIDYIYYNNHNFLGESNYDYCDLGIPLSEILTKTSLSIENHIKCKLAYLALESFYPMSELNISSKTVLFLRSYFQASGSTIFKFENTFIQVKIYKFNNLHKAKLAKNAFSFKNVDEHKNTYSKEISIHKNYIICIIAKSENDLNNSKLSETTKLFMIYVRSILMEIVF